MAKNHMLTGIAFLTLILAAGCGEPKQGEHPDHDEHSESEHAGETETEHAEHGEEDHAGESPDEHATEEPDIHEGEGEIELTPEHIELAGITLAKAGPGKIKRFFDLAGEVGFNEDRLVHITPRFAGIALEARFKVGDFVNASDVVAVIESNESLTHYSLTSPISGRIIEKHVAPGEHVSETESVYLLADLSTVWVNIAVYPVQALMVNIGQKASVSAVGSDQVAIGSIHYVSPVIDAQTRQLTARIVLPNTTNQWRPGTFVNAHIEAGEGTEGIIVDKAAVQVLDGESVVFVQHEPNTFRSVVVTVGDSDMQHIRILSGLEAGSEYVNNGAFELKAKIVTSSLGAHAGHGH